MAKIVYCKEVGFDCDGVVRAETDGELLVRVSEHANAVHGLEMITCEIIEKVRKVTRDE